MIKFQGFTKIEHYYYHPKKIDVIRYACDLQLDPNHEIITVGCVATTSGWRDCRWFAACPVKKPEMIESFDGDGFTYMSSQGCSDEDGKATFSIFLLLPCFFGLLDEFPWSDKSWDSDNPYHYCVSVEPFYDELHGRYSITGDQDPTVAFYCDLSDGTRHWDNNNGNNYVLDNPKKFISSEQSSK